jgi:hypothetical protein
MASHLALFESTLAAQLSLVTRQQLIDAGLTRAQIRTLLRQQILRVMRPQVYGLVGVADSWTRGLLAVVLSCEGAIASHAAAAGLWALEPRPEPRFEISVEAGRAPELEGVTVHRSRTLCPEDIVVRHGVPCTSFERTICDCTTLLSQFQLAQALDDGLRRSIANLDRLRRCCERNESGPGRRMSKVRTLLVERGAAFNPGGSRSELQILEVFRRAQLPEPVQQLRIRVSGRTYRPDFAWPDHMVFAEYYGMPHHTRTSAVVADSKRLTALSAAGWLPLIFTHASSDREIVESTSAALTQRATAGVVTA